MHQLLNQYLARHQQVVLPGIGQLQVWPVPAHYDAGSQKLLPSRLSFEWHPPENVNTPLQPQVGFFSRVSGLPEEECFDALHTFCQEVKKGLEEQGEWSWPSMGKLVVLAGGNISFVPDGFFDAYQEPLEAPRVTHQGRAHQMMVGDRETNTLEMQTLLQDDGQEEPVEGKWWIASVVIGTAAVLLMMARLFKLV